MQSSCSRLLFLSPVYSNDCRLANACMGLFTRALQQKPQSLQWYSVVSWGGRKKAVLIANIFFNSVRTVFFSSLSISLLLIWIPFKCHHIFMSGRNFLLQKF